MENRFVSYYLSSWGRHGEGVGLGMYRFDQDEGQLEFLGKADEKNPHGLICVNRDQTRLYCCNETENFPGYPFKSGRIFTYEIHKEKGLLTRIGEIPTNCPDPCYLSIDGSENYLIAAHHSVMDRFVRHVRSTDGHLVVTPNPVEADLQLYALDENKVPYMLLDNIDHRKYTEPGSAAHPHSCTVSPDGMLIAVTDKGSGHLFMYRIDKEHARLELLDQKLTDCPGANPRHLVFHPHLPYLYLNHEATVNGRPYVSVFRYTPDGKLERLQVIDAAIGEMHPTKEIVLQQQGLTITREGDFLYTLINSDNRISAFSIDSETGRLTLIQNIPVEGVWPRALALCPNEKFMIAGCMLSGDLRIYRRHDNGMLTFHGEGPKQKGASFGIFLMPQV